MRTQLLALAAVSLLVGTGADCCGVGEPQLDTRNHVYESYDYGFAVAVGSEIQLYILTYSESETIQAVKLQHPELAYTEVIDGEVLVQPLAVGATDIEVATPDGTILGGYLTFAERATTKVTADIPYLTYPGGLRLVFAGSRFTAVADHRDAMDAPLLGHGLESWSITGGTLAQPEDDGYFDVARLRIVTAGGDPRIVIHARPDDVPLEVDVVPAGSTVGLDLDAGFTHLRNSGEVTLNVGDRMTFTVSPFSADGRYIGGSPVGAGLTAATADLAVATASAASAQRQTVEIVGVAAGTTNLTLQFDGISRTFALRVY